MYHSSLKNSAIPRNHEIPEAIKISEEPSFIQRFTERLPAIKLSTTQISIMSKKDSLKAKLSQLQCHFTWAPQKENIDLDDMKQRLEDLIQTTVKYQARSYNQLAFVNCLQGNYEEAVQNLQEAERVLRENHEDEFEKRSIITYGNYAWVYYHMGQLTEAQSYLDKLEKICKIFHNASHYTAMIPEVYGEKGWALLISTRKYYDEAKECFEKALEEDPDDTEWNAGYAIVLFRLEVFSGAPKNADSSQSMKQLRRVLELDPNDSVAMVLLALKLQEFKQKEEAFTLVEQALQKSPDLPYVIRYAAKFLRREGSVERSLELLKKALEITPNSAFLYHQVGLCYKIKLMSLIKNPRSRNSHNPAFQQKAELINQCKYHFEKAFELRPLTFVIARLDFATICSLNEEYHEAEEIYSKLLEIEGIHPDNKQAIHSQFGLFELHHKRSESNAITHFWEGLKIKNGSRAWHICCINLRKIATKQIDRNPENSKAFGLLGFMHQLDGEKCEAIECFEKALQIDCDNEEYLSALCELRLSI
ncbi:interferon-induced protein with tetratricopeptide repeats 5-like isoform X1 [Carcharodon carcharias]|uniref:interferon-induced protein with tetratricopeptide repeats 5-like isoform X1 n=3 Tax=Carcharodon carcharias TaxID=13397 RepID=UPI001B7F78D2|nr:interferon-induced protein with tetratricopeptide repeats 5-like isoform X1 [Carcharodon carcharias]